MKAQRSDLIRIIMAGIFFAVGFFVPSEGEETSFWSGLLYWLPFVLFIGVWIFFMRQMQAGTSLPFQRNAVTMLRSIASRWSVALLSLRLGILFPPIKIADAIVDHISLRIILRFRAERDPAQQV